METSPQPHPPSESRRMLAHIIVVTSCLLLVLEIVLFFGFRWIKVIKDHWGGKSIEPTLNPWIIWTAVWIAMLGIVWLWSCRKLAPRWHGKGLIFCCLIGWGLVTWGLILPEPPRVRIKTDQFDRPLPYPGDVKLNYPFD